MPSKFDINPATGKQYGVNPATGVQDDNYWANVVEPQLKYGGSTSGSTGQDATSIYEQFMQKSADLYASKQNELNQYMTNNPFSFDEALARSAVETEYNPWYADKLKQYTTSAQRQLRQGLTSTGQSFESSGLYNSGQRMSAQGKIKELASTEAQLNTNDINAQNKMAVETGILGRKNEALSDYNLRITDKQRSLFGGTSFPYAGYSGSINA